jgi:hypothetical protein
MDTHGGSFALKLKSTENVRIHVLKRFYVGEMDLFRGKNQQFTLLLFFSFQLRAV